MISGINLLRDHERLLGYAQWALVAMVFLLPITMTNLTAFGIEPLTYDQFDLPKVTVLRIAVAVSLALWAAALAAGARIRRTPFDLLLLGMLGWFAVVTVLSLHEPTSFVGAYRRYEGLFTYTQYALVFFLVVQTTRKPADMRRYAGALVVSGSIVSAYGLLQYVGWDPFLWGYLPFEPTRSFSTYGNPDLLGGFLVLVLPVAVALALEESELMLRIVRWVCVALVATVWITSFTRGAWIGGAVALGVLAFAVWRKGVRLRRSDAVPLAILALPVALVLGRGFFSDEPTTNVFARIASIFEFSRGSAQTRFQIWDAAWQATIDSPIVGHGLDTFRLLFPTYKPAEYVAAAGYMSVADNAHNHLLQLAATVGIVGTIVLVGFVVWLLVRSAHQALGADSGSGRLLYAGFWAAAAGYAVHLLFGLSVSGVTALMWLVLGVLAVPFATVWRPDAPLRPGIARTVAAASVAVALATGFIAVRHARADAHYFDARAGIGTIDADAALISMQRAVELNPMVDIYWGEIGLVQQRRLDSAVAAMGASSGGTGSSRERVQALFAEAEAATLAAIEFSPYEFDNYVFLTNLYITGGDALDSGYYAEAVETAEAALERSPNSATIRFHMGRALLGQERLEDAVAVLEDAVGLDPSYLDASILLAEVYLDLGKKDAARELLLGVLKAHPEDAEANALLQQALIVE